MLEAEKEIDGISLSSLFNLEKSPYTRLEDGLSTTFGNKGAELLDEIQRKEQALDALTGMGRLETAEKSPFSLTTGNLMGPPTKFDPLMKDYMSDRKNLEDARNKLQALIEEELESLPELFRTSGGR